MKIRIDNIATGATEEDLRTLFELFGAVAPLPLIHAAAGPNRHAQQGRGPRGHRHAQTGKISKALTWSSRKWPTAPLRARAASPAGADGASPYSYHRACRLNKRLYSPPFRINTSCVPCSMSRPPLSTKIRSAILAAPRPVRNQHRGFASGHLPKVSIDFGFGFGVQRRRRLVQLHELGPPAPVP